MSDYTFIPDLSTLYTEIPPDSILSRTYYNDSQLKAILFGFAAGQELSEHTASKTAILHFLSGEGRLTLGSDEFDVKPGAWVHMPANLPHSVYAHTPLVLLLMMIEGTSGA